METRGERIFGGDDAELRDNHRAALAAVGLGEGGQDH
jgi:hypothetical protein